MDPQHSWQCCLLMFWCGNSVKGPLGGPSLPPLLTKKKRGRERSGEETTYGYYGFCLTVASLWISMPSAVAHDFILVSSCVPSLIHIHSQSWGSAVDALNTTYPLPLPDHRVLLTVVFVPCAYGCITMLYFCT